LASAEERFARFELIEWWDQARLRDARLVVVGGGALGNEIVKNCALLGFGQLVIVDCDRIEASNLSRAVLFRASDAGASKAVAAARAARELYPDLRAVGLHADVVHQIGAGLFRWADLVLGGVDNREARLAVNRHAYRVGTPWIDGAIEALSGVVRLFVPPGPCYECTMSEVDWRLLAQHHSCSLLNRELAAVGKVPTTPTTAAVVAGIQCQEALKLIHGRPSLAGRGFVFDGHAHESYVVDYPRSSECMSHEPLATVVETGARCADVTAHDALGWARDRLGPKARLEFVRELLLALECSVCGHCERVLRPLLAVSESAEQCPKCGARRAPRLFHAITGEEDFLGLKLADLGVPEWDLVVGRTAGQSVGFELDGDREHVLGGNGPG
jgi:molybdopterin/thiamine biosynthesis adenylyltransferase